MDIGVKKEDLAKTAEGLTIPTILGLSGGQGGTGDAGEIARGAEISKQVKIRGCLEIEERW